jgi:dTDP-4-amino-4,6-dideoxygalactose transaminase
MNYKVPILNLQEQFSTIAPELEAAALSVLRSGNYILGEKCLVFEKEMAKLCGCQYGIGVANGTDALELALWALDIGPGDEVITPSFTFTATAEAIALRGAKPVFVEVDAKTFNIDPRRIEALVTKNTKAIMPVHLYGMPANMDEIMSVAQKYSLKVVEDNAQAIGATYKGNPTGSFADISCISFYPTKNLGACGDAGMMVTNNSFLAERLRKLRAHGMKKRYYHDEIGINSRLDELQAALLLAKLAHLQKWNEKRAQLAKAYDQALKNISWLNLPVLTDPDDTTHVWHQYTVVVNLGDQDFPVNLGSGSDVSASTIRDTVITKLAEQGIGSMCYYPIPIHLQVAFGEYGYKKGDLPITERLAERVISLPMYPELTNEAVKQVSDALNKVGQEMLASSIGQGQSQVYSNTRTG